jgi:hypothetical protein
MATENLEIIIGANTQDLQTGLNQASQSVTNFGNAVRTNLKPTADATNALSNLSRVAQDAPYGFMGIANNLNPLLESFQRLSKESGGAGSALKALVGGLTGPAGIGLALGAVSSLVVAFGDDIAGWIANTTELEKAQRQLRASINDSLKGIEATIANDQALVGVINDVTQSTQAREAALKQLKEAHKGNVELQKTDINDGEKLVGVIDRLSQALIRKAQIEGTAKIIGEKYAELIRLQTADLEEQIGDLSTGSKIYDFFAGSLKGLTNNLGGANTAISLSTDALDKNEKQVSKTQKVIKSLQDSLNELTKASFAAGDFNVTGTSAPKAGKNKKEDVDTSVLETLKKTQQLYKDDAYLYKEYADKIVNEELRIALDKAKINKASKEEIAQINEQANTGLIQNQINLGNSLTKLFQAADKEWLNGQLKSTKDRISAIQDQMDIEEKMADKDFEKKKDAVRKAMLEIKKLIDTSSNPKVIELLGDAYDKLGKKLKLLDIDKQQKDAEALQKRYEDFAQVIAENVTNALFTMYDAIQAGEPPLKALGDYVANLAKQFAAAVVQATIFKGLMSLLNVATGGGSGFFGSILGGVSKLLGFAEGGIVSQPTIAMVGEGGQSEAVMPLNKLGNMMNSTFNAGAMSGGGAGNGQFVLKGNDLVLALQRSNYSLNLRRGA